MSIYLFSLFVLLATGSIYVTFPVKNYIYLSSIFFAVMTLFLQILLSKFESRKLMLMTIKNMCILLLFMGIFSGYMLCQAQYWQGNKGNLFLYLILFLFFIPIVWIYFSIFGYKYFIKSYNNVLFAICSISLVLWICVSVLHIVSPSGYVNSGWATSGDYLPTFHNIYFETQNISFFGERIGKNSGIWPEAPMYAMAVSFGLLGEIYLLERKNKLIIFILSLTLLTTFTVSGLTILGLLAADHVIRKSVLGSSSLVKFLIVIFTLLVGGCLGLLIFIIIRTKLNSGSGFIRLDDYLVGYKSFVKSPWIGHGFKNITYLTQFMNFGVRSFWKNGLLTFNTGIANGWVQVFSDGGLLLGTVYVFTFVSGIISKNKTRNEHVLFVILFIMMFMLIMNYTEMLLIFMIIALINTGTVYPHSDKFISKNSIAKES